jgi:hypothetical protein
MATLMYCGKRKHLQTDSTRHSCPIIRAPRAPRTAVLVLNEVLCIWLFSSSSSWLVKERVVIPVDLGGDGAATATFACGPISFCMTDVSPKGAVSTITPAVSFGEFCAT